MRGDVRVILFFPVGVCQLLMECVVNSREYRFFSIFKTVQNCSRLSCIGLIWQNIPELAFRGVSFSWKSRFFNIIYAFVIS